MISYKGKEYKSYVQLAEAYDIPYERLRQRIKRGWTLDRALENTETTPPGKRNYHFHNDAPYKDIEINGKKFRSLNQACDFYGIKLSTISRRISRNNIKPEEAFYELKQPKYIRPETYIVENKYVDHTGKSYDSLKEMCGNYGVLVTDFRERWQEGSTLSDCLSEPSDGAYFIKDPEGRYFLNERAMCKAYGVSIATFRARKRKGYSLEECLYSGKLNKGKPKIKDVPLQDSVTEVHPIVTDHLGNEFSSLAAMCRYYCITYDTFNYHRKRGVTLEETLLMGGNIDHLGIRFESEAALAEFYGKDITYIRIRKQLGLPLSKILSDDDPINDDTLEIFDYKGNKYSNASSMCRAYGFKVETFRKRVNKGLSIGRIFRVRSHTPVNNYSIIYNNIVYKSIKELCDVYGVNYSTFLSRRRTNLPISECLSPLRRARDTSKKNIGNSKSCHDHLGNEYSSYKEMAEAYGLTRVQLRDRLKYGLSIEEALTRPVRGMKK